MKRQREGEAEREGRDRKIDRERRLKVKGD